VIAAGHITFEVAYGELSGWANYEGVECPALFWAYIAERVKMGMRKRPLINFLLQWSSLSACQLRWLPDLLFKELM
jgi:hypothetical protein